MPKLRNDMNIDHELTQKLFKQTVRCPDGHKNTTTAKVCWKCGKPIEGAE